MPDEIPSEPQAPAPPQQPAVDDGKIRSIVHGMIKAMLPNVLEGEVKKHIASLQPPTQDAPKPEPAQTPAAPTSQAQPGDAMAAQLQELQRQISSLQEDNKKKDQKLQKERERAAEQSAFGKIRQSLTGRVVPDAVDALTDIFRARKMVKYDEDGNVSLKVKYRDSADDPEVEEEFALDDGVDRFLKRKEAAIFLPPPAVSGKRNVPQTQSSPRSTPVQTGEMTALQRVEAAFGPIDALL